MLIDGKRCGNAAARGYEVCWQHGVFGIVRQRAQIAAGETTPAHYAARKAKQAAHRAKMAYYRSGQHVAAPESWEHFEQRQAREQLRLSDDFDRGPLRPLCCSDSTRNRNVPKKSRLSVAQRHAPGCCLGALLNPSQEFGEIGDACGEHAARR